MDGRSRTLPFGQATLIHFSNLGSWIFLFNPPPPAVLCTARKTKPISTRLTPASPFQVNHRYRATELAQRLIGVALDAAAVAPYVQGAPPEAIEALRTDPDQCSGTGICWLRSIKRYR